MSEPKRNLSALLLYCHFLPRTDKPGTDWNPERTESKGNRMAIHLQGGEPKKRQKFSRMANFAYKKTQQEPATAACINVRWDPLVLHSSVSVRRPCVFGTALAA